MSGAELNCTRNMLTNWVNDVDRHLDKNHIQKKYSEEFSLRFFMILTHLNTP